MQQSFVSGSVLARPMALARLLNAEMLRRPWLFLLLMAVIYGGGRADYVEFLRFVTNPFDLVLPVEKQFLYYSPLNLWIGAGLSHIVGGRGAYALTGVLGLVLLAASWRHYARAFDAERRTQLLFVVLATPILLVLTKWFGKGDTLLLAAYLYMVACSGRGVTAALAACVMVMAHRDMGILVLAGHCFLRREMPGAAIAGGVVGYLIIAAYQYGVLPHPASSRTHIVASRGLEILRAEGSQPISHLLLAFGWFWIFLWRWLLQADRWRGAAYLAFCFVIMFLTIDSTRDFVMVSTPLVLVIAEWVVTQDAVGRAMATRWPMPLLFMVQAQFVNSTHVVDTAWGQQLIH